MKIIKLSKGFSIFNFMLLALAYIGAGYFILNLTFSKTLIFYLSIILFGIIYSLTCNWILDRKYYSYEMHQIISIPIIIIFIVLNHKLLGVVT